jgi:hydrogenase-4 transcriptional activator
MESRDFLGRYRIEDDVSAGQTALEESRFEEATNYFRSALRKGAPLSEDEARIRCLLSEALEKRGLHREHLEVVSKYEKLAEFSRLSEHSQMLTLIRLGWGYSFNNDLPRAIALFNQALQIARRLEDHSGLGACFFGLGRAYRNYSEIRIARDHYISALEHYRQTGDWRKLAESHLFIGYIYAYEGDFRSALQSLNQALTIIGNREEHDLLGRAHMYLAITYDNLGSTSKALDSWEKCIEHFRAIGNAAHLSINQNNLAEKLVWLGEWPRAEQLVKQAIGELKETSSVAQFACAMDTLGQLYLAQGKIGEAESALRESLDAVKTLKNGEWAEISTQITVGRCLLTKGEPEEAKYHFRRAISICQRTGDLRFASDAKLWLVEALLETGEFEEAREIVEEVRAYLRETPSMLAWGLMMRMLAKIEAADGHIAAAIQSLGQSTSIYSLRGNIYACAINRLILARLFERQSRIQGAAAEVEAALEVFTRLGAAIDERNARDYLYTLEAIKAEAGERPSDSGLGNLDISVPLARSEASGRASLAVPNLASALDGFIAQRLVQASVSRDLLLYELVSILLEQSASGGVLIAEIMGEDRTPEEGMHLKPVAAIGVSEQEQAQDLEFLSRLSPDSYRENFVFSLSDNQQSKYLLHIISPRAERFLAGTVNVRPLLYIVEQGLENQILKSKNRRTQVFDPARLLAQVELPGFVCASRAMSLVLEQIYKIRSSDVTVLITGESGTGKELIARAVHAGSSRRFNTFLPFNCSAAPRDMVESQLFGYRKGAFTGAIASNEGIVRAAERGTLFLDEVGDLPLELQPKLLRFLQEGEIHPIGESQPLKVDVRVVAATNSELERAVSEGRFREDLFHRLNVIRIHVPQLRQRREEIPALINHYLTQYQAEASKSEVRLSEEVVDLMVVYDWPGNVRQLCNEVRRIVAYSDSGQIVTPDLLSPEIVRASREIDPVPAKVKGNSAPLAPATPGGTLAEAVEELERRMIQDALRRSSGNIARAAKELGLSRKGLYLKMDRLNFNL